MGTLAIGLLASCGGGGDPPPGNSASVDPVKTRAARLALPSQSRWGSPFDLGFIPAAAANVPGGDGEGAGRVILWSAQNRNSFSQDGTSTWTAMFDPLAGTATAPRSNATGHNMFCPGTANLPDGRLLVSGGSTETATSLYNATTDSWSAAPGAAFVRPRAYHANAPLRDGSIFALGGSWDGGFGNKDGEVWTLAGGWRALPGIPAGPFITADNGGDFRNDNHMWLFATGNGRVLHAGPSRNMHWIDPRGNGSYVSAGRRADDPDAMNGNAVMYEPGRLLVVGGAAHYDATPATASAFVIDTTRELTVTRVANMAYTRVFHNSVVLPNGQVMVIGGKDRSDAFNDNGARLVPELWDPTTRTFTPLPAMSIPRTYHGVAILLPDARVLSAGSGLCACNADQPFAQVFTPHYLFNDDGTLAMRPRITAAQNQAEFGTTLTVTTDTPINAFSLVRLSSTTHTVNNDQRRIPLTVRSSTGTTYTLDVPSNPGIAVPGAYMLFAINAQGVPSLARTVRIGSGTGIGAAPLIAPVADTTTAVGATASLALSATGGSGGTLAYSATGLPAGLTLNPATGAITGSPTTIGTALVTVAATNGTATTSTDFLWTVTGSNPPPPTGGTTGRYVRLESLNATDGNIWATIAEFNVLGATYARLPRTGWVATASSQETVGENAPASAAIDGSTSTFWHSRWLTTPPTHPHTFTVDLGSVQTIGGFEYLPRQDLADGRIRQFRFYISQDGLNWGSPVATGDFGTMGTATSAKEVRLSTTTPTNGVPSIATPAAQAATVGLGVNLSIAATDPDGDALTFSATGLPGGLAINAGTGAITGTPTTAGAFSSTVSVADGRGGSASTAAFAWTVAPSPTPVVQPVAAPIATVGAAVTLTASATGTDLAYAWDFGDGTGPTPFSSSPSITRTFAAAGVYQVTLTVQGTGGATTTRRFVQAVAPVAGTARSSASASIAYEPRTTAVSRIWAVNPDQNTISVFDATTNARIAEVAVGGNPQTLAVAPNGWVWVVNRETATLSIFQGTTTAPLTLALPGASRPYGIAFAPDGRAYVTLEGTGELLRINADRTLGSRLSVGPNPRQLAVSADGSRVLVSRFITPPLPGEGTATVDVSPTRGAEVVSVLTDGAMSVQGTTILRHSERADSTTQGRGIPNYLGAPAISPDGSAAWVPSKQDNIRRGVLRDGLALDFQNTVRAVASRIALSSTATLPAEDAAARVDLDNASIASAAAFHPSGAFLFVALETSRQVAVVDPFGHRELFRVVVGRAPQGLAVSPDGQRLYVSNFMDRSVTVLDLARLTGFGESSLPVLATVTSVATERLTAQVLLGKRLFYDALDPRLARDGYMSCATCHRDGDQDGRTWDLTGFGEGLRNTIALRGRGGMAHGNLHWTGNFNEVQDFEGQIRNLAGGTGLIANGTPNPPLGTANAGRSTDLDALAAYVASLNGFQPSPVRNADRSLTASAATGRTLFQTLNCASCHGGTAFGATSLTPTLLDIGTLKPSSGQRLGAALGGLETPTLRDVGTTAPYLHDGSAATVEDAIRAHTGPAVSNAGAIAALSAGDLAALADYLRQIGSEETLAPGSPGIVGGRYVRLESLNATDGNPWATIAEFNVLGAAYTRLPRTGWVATASSQETVGENAPASAAIDGSTSTFWHSRWLNVEPNHPHTFTVDLGSVQTIGGFEYLPRQDLADGRIRQFRFYISQDGVNWGSPVVTGDFSTMGTATSAKEVRLSTTAPTNRTPTITTPAAQTGTVGTARSLSIVATDPDGDPLTFTATGLPPGLTLAAGTGVISGTPTTAGAYTVTVSVSDGRGGTASTAAFGWTISAAPLANRAPTITTPTAQTGTVGTARSLSIVATDPDGDPLTFSATGLPPGMTLAAGTGVISGTPTTAGSYSTTVSVSDGRGGTASTAAFGWTISAAPVANRTPTITTPAAQTGTVGTARSLSIVATDPDGDPLTFSATGLPPGMTLAAGTGVISGTPTTAGSYSTTVSVSDGRGGTASTAAFGWTIAAAPASGTYRYVRLVALSEVNGNPWAAMADFNLLTPTGTVIPRTGWTASASSQETARENGRAARAIDGSTGTFWITRWSSSTAQYPHTYTVDLGTARAIGGFRYLPRQDGISNGTIATFRFHVSADGVNWGTAVVTGDFRTLGATAALKEVRFTAP